MKITYTPAVPGAKPQVYETGYDHPTDCKHTHMVWQDGPEPRCRNCGLPKSVIEAKSGKPWYQGRE